ncbi:unnamed protein product [Vitrella brassicaformis CCMP3155]|uniref:Rubredoxin-like domain-containing protein n=1 Tax=Vitrella brassicaformis (strain CCMP3155) TaxID=1169540 RepID=A0A0G4FQS2_VITBC|nr:unnamed protein product [Vitrella brassicaformis CCMP3155]|eukprot:CEM16421.1 unnamed protein product [Vitrella brassicaformis CCMP3155]
MKSWSLVIAPCLLLCASIAHAFTFSNPAASAGASSRLLPRNIIARRAPATALAAETTLTPPEGYWQGEWVCADCGYIYDPSLFGNKWFEDQGPGFKCPQCQAPRRRFAKKVGSVVGQKIGGGDAPIVIFSFLGLALVVAAAVWATYDFPGLNL